MTSPILRLLGGLAAFGSAVLCWFLGRTLAPTLKQHTFLSLDGSHYALFAFLLVPGLILAVVAFFWVPPRVQEQGPLPAGQWWRLVLLLLFIGAFASGLTR